MIPDPPQQLADRLHEGGVGSDDIGIVSLDERYQYSIPHQHYAALARELDGDLVEFTAQFATQHAVKTEVEIDWIRKGCELTDIGMEALAEAAEPGVKEYELEAEIRYAYLKEGGENSVDFINSAPMEGAEEGEAVTWKEPSSRTVEEGGIITTEFRGSYHGHSGQIHRPIAVGQEPTEEYQDMWEIAMETYDGMIDSLEAGATAMDVAEAVAPIEESEYKIYDVLLHGYGNGYLHPFIGTKDSNYCPGGEDPLTANWTFEENMAVVVQPNVLTEDETKGFQVGTTVPVQEDGAEVLLDSPVEFLQV